MLFCDDCLNAMKEIGDKSIDLILTDPPYGTTACKWDSIIPLEPMWEQLKRIIKSNGAIVLFGSQPFTSILINSNLKMFKYEWIWEKSKASNYVHAKFQPLKSHENIIVFSNLPAAQNKKHKMNYFPQFSDGRPYNYGENNGKQNNVLSKGAEKRKPVIIKSDGKRYPRSVKYFKTAEGEGGFIPTQKPVALMEYLIKTYTQENELVLDFAMGSGTTGVACKNLNRNFIGIEKDEKYFEIAKNRIENS